MTQPESHDVVQGAQEELRRQPLAPLRSDFALSMHTPQQLDRLATAAFEILERTGVKVLSPDTLRLLAERGAVVDGARETARLPAELVSRALATAPRSFWFGSRDGSCDLDLASGYSYGTTDGCGIEVIDWTTGERRLSTKADVAEVTRMQDYLGSICFWWPTVGAGDCGETAQLHELDAGWNNTVKHLQGMVQGKTARAARGRDGRRSIAGGREALRAGPSCRDLIGTVSPLVLDRDGIEAALVFAEAGVPVCFVSMPDAGHDGAGDEGRAPTPSASPRSSPAPSSSSSPTRARRSWAPSSRSTPTRAPAPR